MATAGFFWAILESSMFGAQDPEDGYGNCVVDRMQKPWFSDDHVSPIDVCKSLLYPIPLIFRTTLMVI